MFKIGTSSQFYWIKIYCTLFIVGNVETISKKRIKLKVEVLYLHSKRNCLPYSIRVSSRSLVIFSSGASGSTDKTILPLLLSILSTHCRAFRGSSYSHSPGWSWIWIKPVFGSNFMSSFSDDLLQQHPIAWNFDFLRSFRKARQLSNVSRDVLTEKFWLIFYIFFTFWFPFPVKVRSDVTILIFCVKWRR